MKTINMLLFEKIFLFFIKQETLKYFFNIKFLSKINK